MTRVLLLLHERHVRAAETPYVAWTLADLWRERGIRVEVARGFRNLPDADVVLPHLDLTVLPEVYRRALERYPRVLNRAVVDISKRAISRHLVHPGDGHDGPVIVKSDRNAGGQPDRLLLGRSFSSCLARLRSRLLSPSSPVDTTGYAVYRSAAEVPARVWRDRSLVVERFLPERDDDLYCLGVYTFLGDRHVSSRLRGTSPVVKAGAVVDRTPAPVPEALVAERRRLGFDYGKFDYVMRDGAPILLDANRTPTWAGPVTGARRARAETLADGLDALLASASAVRPL